MGKQSGKYTPDLKSFLKLAKRGSVIPVYRKILADFETPLSAYLKLEGKGPAFLLESVEGGERLGRYSFLGSAPRWIMASRGRQMTLRYGSRTQRWMTQTDPLDELEQIMRPYKSVHVDGLPRFAGGVVGFAGYDMVRFFEPIGPELRHPAAVPDSVWMLCDTVVIFDHVERVMKVVVNAMFPGAANARGSAEMKRAYAAACRKIDRMVSTLHKPVKRPRPTGAVPIRKSSVISSNISKPAFLKKVDQAKKEIGRGEAIQIVLSQRFSRPIRCKAFEIYRALRSLNPSPYMFYLNFNQFALVGSSPEILVRCEGGVVENRPIAGTRPRGDTPAADRMIEAELRRDPKERAEHLMLADLGRNDAGRVSEYGTVQVRELMTVERYSHVMHLVSSVTGKLKKGLNAFDVLRAAFPAGTVSGAPKVRAMQIINTLEPDARGPYAGAVGYIDFSGNLDTSIAIRTVLVKGKMAYVQAGAGIVADSKPLKEYEETRSKAAGMLEAIRRAEAGLEYA